jgi:hypothetical protein
MRHSGQNSIGGSNVEKPLLIPVIYESMKYLTVKRNPICAGHVERFSVVTVT